MNPPSGLPVPTDTAISIVREIDFHFKDRLRREDEALLRMKLSLTASRERPELDKEILLTPCD